MRPHDSSWAIDTRADNNRVRANRDHPSDDNCAIGGAERIISARGSRGGRLGKPRIAGDLDTRGLLWLALRALRGERRRPSRRPSSQSAAQFTHSSGPMRSWDSTFECLPVGKHTIVFAKFELPVVDVLLLRSQVAVYGRADS